MNTQQLSYLTEQLQQQRKELLGIDGGSEPDLSVSMTADVGELSGYDNHPADLGSEMYERSLSLTLNEHEDQQLADITHSLRKIADGTYGACEECGKEIPYERLEAMPTARYCIEHQEAHDAGEIVPHTSDHLQGRPVEEDILSSHTRKKSDAGRENAWQDVAEYNDRPHDPGENKE
ncbi:TraR/DksA C4-type zinc finger protein [Aneurinibacillus sp. BA2021]|nr:TraR/DksA C4-type zinc finger protein [Aneurinibacillus sp. BA2021]